MNRARLQELADLLRTVPVEKFDLDNWACGTTACAVGWACAHKPFNKCGFFMTKDEEEGGRFQSPVFDFDDMLFEGWDAVDKFFGLDGEESWSLFSNSAYGDTDFDGNLITQVPPGRVADRIEEFIKDAP